MTIAFGTAGTVGVGSTSVTAGLPAGLADGDGVLIVVVTKPDSATPVTPTGWAFVGNDLGGAGSHGNGTGPTKCRIYFREKDASWSAMPAHTVTSGNATAAQAFRYTKEAGTAWGTPIESSSVTYNPTTAGTAVSHALDTLLDLTEGDLLFVALSNHDDAPTWSAQSVTATGISAWGTATERSETIETTTGFDVGGMVFDCPVTTGTASAAPVVTATASAASTGVIVAIRLREVVPMRPRNIMQSNPALHRSYTY